MAELSIATTLLASLSAYQSRVAVQDCSGTWQLTGDELLGLARSLSRRIPQSERPILAYLDKGPTYYAFLAYAFLYRVDFCPVDKSTPIARVHEIASQLRDPIIVTDNENARGELRAITSTAEIIVLGNDSAFSDDAAHPRHLERRAVYYIATSGSTGRPKLVRVPHDNTLPFVRWAGPFYGISAACRWGQFSSVGFDLSLVDFLSTLCFSGTLVALCSNVDRLRPALAISKGRISHWHSVPSMIPYFLADEAAFKGTEHSRLFTFCGEPLSTVDAGRLAAKYPGSRIVNTYGPTEATLFCSFYEFSAEDKSTSYAPIGTAIPGWNFVLRGGEQERRLVIVSDFIADGYEGLESDAFCELNLFGEKTRAFDTGDYFAIAGPHLYFSHRKDTMVKLSGNRVDLGEIEAVAREALLPNPIAIVHENSVVLFVEGESIDTTKAREFMDMRLPKYSIPRDLVFLDRLPRTVNGKIDRQRLKSLSQKS
jgi:D-alanine--poly(phosphoribitol) ligase subunit 1